MAARAQPRERRSPEPSDPLTVAVAPSAARAHAPHVTPPRGLRREQAAAYVGVSASYFDTLVDAGLMPSPKRLAAGDTRGVAVWDRLALDFAFEALPDAGSTPPANPMDRLLTQ